MKIGVVSDTHGNVANFKKAVNWLSGQGIDVVLHCGDIGSPESMKESLAGFKGEFFGILGNMDADFEMDLKEYNFGKVKVAESNLELEFDGKKIAMAHKPEPAKKLAETGKYNLVFYGHTHKPNVAQANHCLLVNPGELAGQLFKPSFAVYDTSTGKLELKILETL